MIVLEYCNDEEDVDKVENLVSVQQRFVDCLKVEVESYIAYSNVLSICSRTESKLSPLNVTDGVDFFSLKKKPNFTLFKIPLHLIVRNSKKYTL